MTNKEYKYFDFDNIFDYKRGARLINQNQIPGDIAYISSTALNNGVSNYIIPPDYLIKYRNKLTLSNSGSVGYMFYHDYEFVASDHVMVVWPKNVELNKFIALFLKPVFESIRYRYNFGREITDTRLPKEQIYLPIDKNGDVDWKYMEEYIGLLHSNIKFSPIKTQEKELQNLDLSCWGEFKFIDRRIWEKITHGQRLIAANRIPGDTTYYSASEYNNGITDSIDNPLFTVSDCIVYSTFGTAFWAEGEFTASDEIYAFHNKRLNKFNALFIATVMRQNQYKFKFGRKAFYNKFKNETILLPVDKNGNLDWDYMENYIKALPYAEYLKLS